jgi:hypothetical protein
MTSGWDRGSLTTRSSRSRWSSKDVQDKPLFCERVAGLDIAKAEVEVTVRVPSDTTAGRRQQETRTFGTTRCELESLGDWPAASRPTGAVHVRGHSVETELVALDVLHPEARLVVAIGRQ